MSGILAEEMFKNTVNSGRWMTLVFEHMLDADTYTHFAIQQPDAKTRQRAKRSHIGYSERMHTCM
jgi:hypothetical protein